MAMDAILSIWKNSVTLLCFIQSSMSDTILSECPSAATYHTATKWNGTLLGRFNLYCHPSTSASDSIGQHHTTGSITFRSALVFFLCGLLNLSWHNDSINSSNRECLPQSSSLTAHPPPTGGKVWASNISG